METELASSIMIQGLMVDPWAVRAKLDQCGLAGDVRVQLRPRALGHVAVINLQHWRGSPFLQCAAADERVGPDLASLLRFLVDHSYALQLVIKMPGADDVDGTLELTPQHVAELLPHLCEMGSLMVFVRNQRMVH